MGFAANEDGKPTETWLEFLSILYPPELAEVAIHLDIIPDTVCLRNLAKKLGRNKSELGKLLHEPSKKFHFIILGGSVALPDPTFLYDAPVISANVEKSGQQKDLARLSMKFFNDGWHENWVMKEGVSRMRVMAVPEFVPSIDLDVKQITVDEKVSVNKRIMPPDEIYSWLDKFDFYALMPCSCRNRMEVLGIRKCKDKYPIRTCIAVGKFGKMVDVFGDKAIEPISKKQVMEIVRMGTEKGLIHCTDSDEEETILCSCCECCCSFQRSLREFNNPNALIKAHYNAVVDAEACSSCGTCKERCKFNAVEDTEKTFIDPNKCVGCGLCAPTCPEGAISLHLRK
jgi:ferredoxin